MRHLRFLILVATTISACESANDSQVRILTKRGAADDSSSTARKVGEIKDLERSLQDALDYKFIATPKTPADIAGLFDIVYKPK